MCDAEKLELKELEIISIFGFDGKIQSGLKIHPDQKHIIFPLGNKVSIINFDSNKQEFLCGHTNTVSAINVSPTGKLIASGQINHMGFRAYIIIWNWETKKETARHQLHKVRVESLTFTPNENFLISLGGRDCGQVLVWNIIENVALCGQSATNETTGMASRISGLHRRDAFVTGGEQNLRLWFIDKLSKKLTVQDVAVGKLRRIYTGIKINSRDEIMYVGTMSGDVVKIRLNCHHDAEVIQSEKSPILLGCFAKYIPKRPYGKECEKYKNGVRDLWILPNGNLIIGAGDGTIDLVEERNVIYKDYPSPTWPQFKSLKKTKVDGVISTIQLIRNNIILIGTESSEIYSIQLSTFELKLLKTCHTSAVYDIAFPYNFSVVFATASHQTIRIWSTTKMQELLRIMVPNFTAAAVIFSRDGKSIISGWNDGIIRAFTPLTGKLIYSIANAHNKGCSALSISSNGRILVSGGCEGQIRIWKIESHIQSLIGVLKEHVGPIATVDFNNFDNEIVSSSTDGTCIIWDINRLSRKHVLFANTQFTCARYYPNGVQILTSGSDRRVSYWEVYDGCMARNVEASMKGAINCIDINKTGEMFLSVGHDQIVKLWKYQEGISVGAGYGHAGVITSGKYSPCGKFLVTGSSDGAVFIWKVPKEFYFKEQKIADEPKLTGKKRSSKIDDENISEFGDCVQMSNCYL